jgi:ABC-type transport system involved in cytochrome bd biosynthesis fused ATPase/permease subunit
MGTSHQQLMLSCTSLLTPSSAMQLALSLACTKPFKLPYPTASTVSSAMEAAAVARRKAQAAQEQVAAARQQRDLEVRQQRESERRRLEEQRQQLEKVHLHS